MAEGKADGPAKKPAFSNWLLQMKFMQRGKEKPIVKEAVTAQVRSPTDLSFPAWLVACQTHFGSEQEMGRQGVLHPTQCCGITRSMAKFPWLPLYSTRVHELLVHLVSAAFCPGAQPNQERSPAAVIQGRLEGSNDPAAAKTRHNSTHQCIPSLTLLTVFCPG